MIETIKGVEKKEKEIWFRRKRYGWGWYPASWKGWMVTFGYIVLVVAGAYGIPFFEAGNNTSLILIYLIVISILFIAIAWKKGESLRWQWGDKRK